MLSSVSAESDIAEFLTIRRARLTPEQVGLPTYGPRRVKGLRREEVASRAGVSVEYYKRLERGNASGVSDAVLEALARALQLDDAERAHLFDLARASHAIPGRRRRVHRQIRPSVLRVVEAMATVPAFVRNGRLDLLAANRLGRALYSQHFDSPFGPANTARFVFLDSRSTFYYRDWEGVANDVVATLRAEAGRDPYDRELSDLVGQLSTRSETFGARWAAHNVRRHDTGVKLIHHPVVGDLNLTFEALELVADPGLTMFVYTAEAGSKSQEALDLLASWTATEGGGDADHEELRRDRAGTG